MSLSQETHQKIQEFAEEQSQHYIEAAEMTYLEQLKKNTTNAKHSLRKELAKFRPSSKQTQEARNDLVVYMADYMNDLIAQGSTEAEAFAKAKEALTRQDTNQYADMNARFLEYYLNMDPAEQEVIGLYYGGLTVIGMVLGALVGFLLSGGKNAFMTGGWQDTLIGFGVGTMIGVGLALICNAVIVSKGRN